jgi:hypothetical protein
MSGSVVGYNQTLGEIGGCKACGMTGGAKKTKKRKLSAYNKFMKTEMTKLKKQYPDKQQKDILKMAAANWKKSK